LSFLIPLTKFSADSTVAAPLSIRNTKSQLINEYIVNNALPIKYGIVNLSGGTSPRARAHPTAIATSPAIPMINGCEITIVIRDSALK
jgi:hypothetical protein